MDEWEFERSGERKVVKVPRTLMTDDREGLIAAALAGSGLVRAAMFDPALITSGRLRKVLNDWTCLKAPSLYAIYSQDGAHAAQIAAILEFTAEGVRCVRPRRAHADSQHNLSDSLPRAQLKSSVTQRPR